MVTGKYCGERENKIDGGRNVKKIFILLKNSIILIKGEVQAVHIGLGGCDS
jgi:hypothetical protein